jgi:3,4-dihydroxy-9,10-secoandrosta-1,3,5(10)-triene-9,17-dione 4,5-dioxygenase
VTQIRGLGYVKVQTRHIERWREFALEGLHLSRRLNKDSAGRVGAYVYGEPEGPGPRS